MRKALARMENTRAITIGISTVNLQNHQKELDSAMIKI